MASTNIGTIPKKKPGITSNINAAVFGVRTTVVSIQLFFLLVIVISFPDDITMDDAGFMFHIPESALTLIVLLELLYTSVLWLLPIPIVPHDDMINIKNKTNIFFTFFSFYYSNTRSAPSMSRMFSTCFV